MSQTEAVATGTEFVAYEYTTVRADRDLESLYRDAYRNFGWVAEGYATTMPGTGAVTLKFKRDRRVKNRALVLELQRKCQHALDSIASLERSKTTTATAAAVGTGIVGSSFLAGSVFSLEADLTALSIVLGAVGLIGWLVGYLAHGRVKAKKTAQVTPLIDQQYDVVYETGEQAAHLLA
jgi:hypothetical protein